METRRRRGMCLLRFMAGSRKAGHCRIWSEHGGCWNGLIEIAPVCVGRADGCRYRWPRAPPSALDNKPKPGCDTLRIGRRSINEAKVDAARAQLGEITLDDPVLSVELHPYRHHLVPARNAGIPDLAAFIGTAVCVLIGRETGDIFAGDVAGNRRAGEVLGSRRGQGLRPSIGKAEVVAA